MKLLLLITSCVTALIFLLIAQSETGDHSVPLPLKAAVHSIAEGVERVFRPQRKSDLDGTEIGTAHLSASELAEQIEALNETLTKSTDALNANTLSPSERKAHLALFEKRNSLRKRLLELNREQILSRVNDLEKDHASRVESAIQQTEESSQ